MIFSGGCYVTELRYFIILIHLNVHTSEHLPDFHSTGSLRDTKAYLSLGYESFEDFGRSEFGYEKQQLYRLAAAAEVENTISIPRDTLTPEKHLRPLAQIDESERQAIWDDANRKAEYLKARLIAYLVANWLLLIL